MVPKLPQSRHEPQVQGANSSAIIRWGHKSKLEQRPVTCLIACNVLLWNMLIALPFIYISTSMFHC